MKRAVTVLVLVFCLIVVMSVSGAKLEGGGGIKEARSPISIVVRQVQNHGI